MIKIKGFKNYMFCPKKIKVFSIRENKLHEIKPIRNRGGVVKYALYKNGIKNIISLFDVLKIILETKESIK